ncbi:MAG TPA: hypothetical protein VFF04_04915 [Candidatus Babeliales bacterium]|nr:hypothetical protein [Candidatus Babeliales bacterium]
MKYIALLVSINVSFTLVCSEKVTFQVQNETKNSLNLDFSQLVGAKEKSTFHFPMTEKQENINVMIKSSTKQLCIKAEVIKAAAKLKTSLAFDERKKVEHEVWGESLKQLLICKRATLRIYIPDQKEDSCEPCLDLIPDQQESDKKDEPSNRCLPFCGGQKTVG